jgi:hypothetical protein
MSHDVPTGFSREHIMALPDLHPDRMTYPLALIWPRPGNPGPVYLRYSDLAESRQFIAEFDLNPLVPQVMWDKYRRAQKLNPEHQQDREPEREKLFRIPHRA